MNHGTLAGYAVDKCRCEDCTTAQRAYKREYRRRKGPAYAAKRAKKARQTRIEKLYGITYAEYEGLIVNQCGRCAICGDNPLKLVIDHCHTTGAHRGLLCDGCNTGLGCFQDDPERMIKAAGYIADRSL